MNFWTPQNAALPTGKCLSKLVFWGQLTNWLQEQQGPEPFVFEELRIIIIDSSYILNLSLSQKCRLYHSKYQVDGETALNIKNNVALLSCSDGLNR